MPRRCPNITMIGGSRTEDPRVLGLAEALGEALSHGDYNLICGGGTGTMAAACRGFGRGTGPGRSMGILPGGEHHRANPFVDIVLPTGIGYARNALVVQAGHAVVAVGGESGTLSELALAWQFGRPIAVLEPAGGHAAAWADLSMDPHRGDTIRGCEDVDQVMAWLATLDLES